MRMNRSESEKVSQSSRFAFTLASRGKGKIRITHQADIDPIPFQRVKLSSIHTKDEVDESWKTYSLEQEMRYKERDRTHTTGRSHKRGISALSRRLMSLERARALGRKPADPQAYFLELEARRLTQERAKRTQ